MSSVLTRERASPCAPDGARDDARRAVALAAGAEAGDGRFEVHFTFDPESLIDGYARLMVEGDIPWIRHDKARRYP